MEESTSMTISSGNIKDDPANSIVPFEQPTKKDATPARPENNTNGTTTHHFQHSTAQDSLGRGWQTIARVNNWRVLVPHCIRMNQRIQPCLILITSKDMALLEMAYFDKWEKMKPNTSFGETTYVTSTDLIKENKKHFVITCGSYTANSWWPICWGSKTLILNRRRKTSFDSISHSKPCFCFDVTKPLTFYLNN